ncbi:MAG: chemotaxis protein CheA [Steroidobacteraceae bacterium]
MTIDLAQFHESFFEESFEALDSMEAALLKLNPGAPEAELINTIFRVAHSIKGGSATFGFTEITSFTHTTETFLDELRSNRMQVSKDIMDLLLKAVDVMRDMLRAVQNKNEIDVQRVADLQFDLEVAIIQKAPSMVDAVPTTSSPAVVSRDAALPVWQIHFRPYPQLFVYGNDPLRMLRELGELGTVNVMVNTNELPGLKELDAESCLLSWELHLATEVTREVIAQVFDWAEGDCHLEIKLLEKSAKTSLEPVIADAGNSQNVVPLKSITVEPVAENIRNSVGDSGSIRVSIEKIDELLNAVGELVITQSMLGQLGSHVKGDVAEQLRSGLTQLERNVRELQENVMRVRMLPISFVFSRFPRMVRDLSSRLGKDIDLKMTGENTELDKTVMERIGDPLTHLIRNSIDHGIEGKEARIAAGKPAIGTVYLNAYHKGGNIIIEVKDDGGGMNKERILTKACERGLVGVDDMLTDEQICDLIFVPGFSTAEKTSDVSGRGVGMDVVRRNVKELGGSIEVRSDAGKGSCFVITLPLTLSIVDGQSVSVGDENYIVPLTAIIESMQLKPSMVNLVAGRGEVFRFRDEYLPIIRLHKLFDATPRALQLTDGLLMVVEGEGRKVGLFVDDLLGQQQVVIKSLEANYRSVAGISGATILGDGSVALILDVPGIIRIGTERLAA